jgi:hypothetical protein
MCVSITQFCLSVCNSYRFQLHVRVTCKPDVSVCVCVRALHTSPSGLRAHVCVLFGRQGASVPCLKNLMALTSKSSHSLQKKATRLKISLNVATNNPPLRKMSTRASSDDIPKIWAAACADV